MSLCGLRLVDGFGRWLWPLLVWCLLPIGVRAQTFTLQSPELTESSGLALVGEQIWTHNDSGDRPRLFVFDRRGASLGQVEVLGAQAEDWEDMCAFSRGQQHYVAVGDVGDNGHQRASVTIYVIEIPAHLRNQTQAFSPAVLKLPVAASIEVTYPDGAVNCEALAFDPRSDALLLATKELTRCRLFQVPLGALQGRQRVEAKWLGSLLLPLITAADISPDGKRLCLTTYGPACLLERRTVSPRETDWELHSEAGLAMLPLPSRKQGESVCFSLDGSRLLLTSEFAPTPVWEVAISGPVRPDAKAPPQVYP